MRDRLIKSIHNKVKSICQPNPKLWPDPFIYQQVWERNMMNISTHLKFLVIFCLISAIFNFSLSLKLIVIGLIVFQILVFMVLCRSYLWVCNMFFALVLFLASFLVLERVPEAVYCYTGLILILVATIMRKTRDARVALLSGVAQMFLFLTKFKEKFIMTLEEGDPRIFADKFVKMTLACYLILLVMSIALFKALDRRTLELSRSKAALEIALEQQKTFIFSFSHELRNPINSLLGNLQLVLQGETLSTKTAEMINVAKVCGELLLHNINNVLDTGKHDIGKLEMNSVPTRLHELFQRTWSIYSELLRQKKLKSQLRIEKELPAMVMIDSHKVNQIMLNLIGNAIKFTEKGSVMVTIKWLKNREMNEKCFHPIPYDDTDEGLFEKEENLSTMCTSRFSTAEFDFSSGSRRAENSLEAGNRQEETTGVLKIIVKDTGCGMRAEALEKLFQKFSQVSESAAQRQIGTGLGLFISKEICHAMKGEVRAYSKLGIGTTFVVCIPTTSVRLTDFQRANTGIIMRNLKHKQIKALVADDSPFNVNLICDYFSQSGGSTVSVAYNGYDIFMKYKECMASGVDVDIITLDIDMPGMDGREVCRSIRKYEGEKRLKPVLIILMSGNYDKEQIDDYLDSGRWYRADCFLRKPVSFSEFTRSVYNLINH